MFDSESSVKLIKQNENILVLRTFSKVFGLPSIRFGYIIGNSKIIRTLNTYRLSYESNMLADKVVEYFIKNKKVVFDYINEVKKGKEYIKKGLSNLGLEVIGEKSNYLLINFKNKKLLRKILNRFNKTKIYVKSNYTGELKYSILITCGKIYTMKKVLKIIKYELEKK